MSTPVTIAAYAVAGLALGCGAWLVGWIALGFFRALVRHWRGAP